MLRQAAHRDAASLAAIYNHYILHSTATFEETPLSAADMAARLERISLAGLPWLLLEEDSEVLAYAYAAPWRERSAYRYSAEVSAYVHPAHRGRGLGRRLYAQLVEQLAAGGHHSAIGVVPLPNPASAALHEALGFAKVAQLAEVGFKFGRWIDVGYWQRLLTPTA